MDLAAAMADKIKGSYTEPKLFGCFPEMDRVKLSERFIPKNFLGQPFLKNGYRVDYKNGGSSYHVFVVKNVSRKEAEEVLGKYQDFLKSQNEELTHVRKEHFQLFSTKGAFFSGSF